MALLELLERLELMPRGTLIPADWVLEELTGEGSAPRAGTPSEKGNSLVDLTVDEVAEMMGRSPSTVREWCRTEPALGARKIRGKEWRIPAAGLRRFQEGEADGGQEADAASGGSAKPTNDDLGSWRDELPS